MPTPAQSCRHAVTFALSTSLSLTAWAGDLPAPALADLPGASQAIAAISQRCDTPQNCLQQFSRVTKFDVENQGSTTFLFSPSSAFSGNAQAYYYREALFPATPAERQTLLGNGETLAALAGPESYMQKIAEWGHSAQGASIEVQIGFGHFVVAKQKNANLAGTGTVSSLPLALGNDSGKLYFQAALLGLATALPADCSQPGSLNAQQNLMCGVPVLPTVDQNNFRNTANTLNDRATLAITELAAGKGSLCPQILNARIRLWEKADEPGESLLLPVTPEVLSKHSIGTLQQQLNQAGSCQQNKRPNLFATYRNDTPIDASLSFTDSSLSSKLNRYSISYARRALATSQKHGSDRYLAAWVKVIDDAAKLPSLSFIGTLFSAQLSRDYLNIQLDSGNLPGGTALLGTKVPATVDGLPNWDSKDFIRAVQTQVNQSAP